MDNQGVSLGKLGIIDRTFIQSDCKAPFLTSNTNDNFLPVCLATKTAFGNKYNPNPSSSPTITGTTVYYETSASPSWTTTMPSSYTTLKSINFTGIITGSDLLALLNNLRICYNLLGDTARFSAYKSQTVASTLSVNQYSMTTPGTYDIAEKSAINNAMNAVFTPNTPLTKLDPDKTNFEAIRRLLKAYEYIVHVYIAMTFEPSPASDGSTPGTPITDLILNKLNADNNAVIDTTGEYVTAQSRLLNTTNRYSNSLDTVDGLDIKLEDLKEEVVKEKTNKTTNSNILKKNTIVYYVFLLLFIILVCVLLYSLQNQEDEKSKIYVGGVLATSIVAMIVIYFLNMTYLKEGFTTETDAQSTLNTSITKHLTDTVNIALLSNNNDTYTDVLRVVNKEIDRYDVINKQLKLEAVGTKDIQVDDYRNARVLQYRVYLLLQIMIILSVAMFIYLYTGENILLFIVVLLLVLFMIYLYIMNTHGMVHTDAKKIYWGQPSFIN